MSEEGKSGDRRWVVLDQPIKGEARFLVEEEVWGDYVGGGGKWHVTQSYRAWSLDEANDLVELLNKGLAAEKERDELRAEVERLKAENDERFMIERDEARAEVERLRVNKTALLHVISEYAMHRPDCRLGEGDCRECTCGFWGSTEPDEMLKALYADVNRMSEALETILSIEDNKLSQGDSLIIKTATEALGR